MMKTKINYFILSLVILPSLVLASGPCCKKEGFSLAKARQNYKVIKKPLVIEEDEASASSEEEVTVNEDLMHEHGLLNRLLLIYEEIANRLQNKTEQSADMGLLHQATTIVRDFLEDHHEIMEEQYIFPVVATDSEWTELVNTLKQQHIVGRQLTDFILSSSTNQAMSDSSQRQKMVEYLQLYVRMFRPHEAREDTVIFPRFRSLLSDREYQEMSEMFEKHEEETIGDGGFDIFVNNVANIEKALGIYNLSQFTPTSH